MIVYVMKHVFSDRSPHGLTLALVSAAFSLHSNILTLREKEIKKKYYYYIMISTQVHNWMAYTEQCFIITPKHQKQVCVNWSIALDFMSRSLINIETSPTEDEVQVKIISLTSRHQHYRRSGRNVYRFNAPRTIPVIVL